jgi:hypothetical protein
VRELLNGFSSVKNDFGICGRILQRVKNAVQLEAMLDKALYISGPLTLPQVEYISFP